MNFSNRHRLLLAFYYFCERNAHSLSFSHSHTGPSPSSTVSTASISHILLLKDAVPFWQNENFTSFSLSRVLSYCCVLVLKSTPKVSTLVAKHNPSLLLHSWKLFFQTTARPNHLALLLFSSFRDRHLQALLFHLHPYRLQHPLRNVLPTPCLSFHES